MTVLSFVIFAVVALVTVLFSLFIALVISRRKNPNIDDYYGNQLSRYTIEENQNQNFRLNNRISEYDESDSFVIERGDSDAYDAKYQDDESDVYYFLSKRNFTVAGSRVVTVKPSRIVEPVQNRQIRLQFK
jgi:ABC-type multidrug transport system fused ATPase/permease subunit